MTNYVTHTCTTDATSPPVSTYGLPFEYDIKEAIERLYQRRNELLDENESLRFKRNVWRVLALVLGAVHLLSFFLS